MAWAPNLNEKKDMVQRLAAVEEHLREYVNAGIGLVIPAGASQAEIVVALQMIVIDEAMKYCCGDHVGQLLEYAGNMHVFLNDAKEIA